METKVLQQIQKMVEEFMEKLGLSPKVLVESDEENQVKIKLESENEEESLGLLIGYHGETLRSLQLLLSLMINKNRTPSLRILLDVGDYRKGREDALAQMVKEAIEKVKETNEDFEMRPMSSMDRRFVHLIVSKNPGFSTESVGEGWERRVVVKMTSLPS